MFFYEAVPNLVAVAINKNAFRWSYGTVMPEITEEAFNSCKFKIRINVVSGGAPALPAQSAPKLHYFSADGELGLIYQRPALFNKTIGYTLRGLEGNVVDVTVNSLYLKVVKHRLLNLHSIQYILTDLLNFVLLRDRYLPLHCSAVSKNGKAFLIFAPPNTGKTYTAIQLIKHDGFSYLSEDLAIYKEGAVHSVPWTSTFRYYEDIESSFLNRLRNKAMSVFPAIELFGAGSSERISKYISSDRISSQDQLAGVFILERGERSIESLDRASATTKCRLLNRYEFNHMRAPALVAYSYFFGLDLFEAEEWEKRLTSELVSYCESPTLVCGDKVSFYPHAIAESIKANAT